MLLRSHTACTRRRAVPSLCAAARRHPFSGAGADAYAWAKTPVSESEVSEINADAPPPDWNVRKTQKWLEGRDWAEKFASSSLIAFTHVKGGDIPTINRMVDQLAAKGVVFKFAKNTAIQKGKKARRKLYCGRHCAACHAVRPANQRRPARDAVGRCRQLLRWQDRARNGTAGNI